MRALREALADCTLHDLGYMLSNGQIEERPGISNDILSIEIRLNNPARRAQDEKVKNENVSAIYCVSRLLYT